MRFNEFTTAHIMEHSWGETSYTSFISNIEYDEQGAHSLANFIKQNCGQWLSLVGGGRAAFYRGITLLTLNNGTAAVAPIRKDRPPRDSSRIQNIAFTAMITAAGGIANRNNSAFITASRKAAMAFGNPYVFMPLGDFHYTWSTIWKDWTAELPPMVIIEFLKPEIKQQFKTDTTSPSAYAQVYSMGMVPNELDRAAIFSNPNNYIDEIKLIIKSEAGLKEAWKAKHEVMVAAEAGLYINPEFYSDFVEKFLLDDKLVPKKSGHKAMGIVLDITDTDSVRMLLINSAEELKNFGSAVNADQHQSLYTNKTQKNNNEMNFVEARAIPLAKNILFYPLNSKTRIEWINVFHLTPEQYANPRYTQ